jgi:5-methyltetrahydropteroyltriglutamate--homocysteine methyltransferase
MSQKQNISTPFQTTIPGYPRVASQRAYKSLLEGYWNRKLFRAEFEQGAETLRTERLETQSRLGLDIIPVGDFSLYDQVLDTAIQFGCIPDRYEYDGGEIDHDLYFAMARGRDGVAPLEMTKWFDTNYHYLAPELPAEFRITSNRTLTAFRHARTVVGDKAKPVMIGPFTFLKLARVSAEFLGPRLGELVPLYRQVLKELAAEGASLIQVDEPFLVCDIEPSEIELFRQAYKVLTEAAPILLQTYFGDVAAHYDVLSGLPFAGIGLDFVHGRAQNLSVLSQGFPSDTVLVAGVVNGRNVWRTDLDDVFELVQSLTEIVSPDRLILGSSCSLLHLPETTAPEIGLPLSLKQALSFAQERVIELDLLSQALRNGKASVAEPWREMRRALDDWNSNQDRFDVKVQTRSRNLDKEPTQRRPYAERRGKPHVSTCPYYRRLLLVRSLRLPSFAGHAHVGKPIPRHTSRRS